MDDDGGMQQLPASIELAWGLRESPNKGPKRGLSLRQIVDAAVTIADEEGLDAVSMKRVATELGAATMALYRYLGAKDEMVTLMADAIYGSPPRAHPGHDWRAGLSQWAWSMLDALRRHPWAVHVPISGPPITPNVVLWMEQALRCLDDTGLSGTERVSTLLLISGHVRNQALLEVQLGISARRAGTDTGAGAIGAGYGRLLARLTDRTRFPALHAAIETGALDDEENPDDELGEDFAFGLERILDGIAATIARRA